MNSLSLLPSTEAGQGTQAIMPVSMVSSRIKIAQEASLQTIERVRQALEKQFSGLVGENTSLRKELSSSTLQNRELILVQRKEIRSLQEQLMSTQTELAHVREEKETQIAALQQEIVGLREELRRFHERALAKEQETVQTLTALRQELQQSREETAQRLRALQTEKEAALHEVGERTTQQIAQAREEERALASQDFERRISHLRNEEKNAFYDAHKKKMEVANKILEEVGSCCMDLDYNVYYYTLSGIVKCPG